jgi:ABC-2 type transport system permease protein
MKKFLEVFRVSMSQYLAFRLSFVLWRVRMIFSLLLIYYLWTAVYLGQRSLFGYTPQEMMTYVLFIYFLGDLVYSTRTSDLANYIRSGEIINYMLKPFSVLKYMLTKEIADKLINLAFAIMEIVLIVLIAKPQLYLQTNISVYPWFLLAMGLGLVSAYFMYFCLSLIAFWTAEIWAPRFIFFVMITTLSGSYFPLDILPTLFYRILMLTPFPYYIYLPAQIYLKGVNGFTFVQLAISALWVFIMFIVSRFLWRKGIKEFSFFGR